MTRYVGTLAFNVLLVIIVFHVLKYYELFIGGL